LPRFGIGQQFNSRQTSLLCAVTDILKTYSLSGGLVKIRYVANREFEGQILTNTQGSA
jgi:hypothetical protein